MTEMRCGEVLSVLKNLGNPRNVEGMARFGIKPAVALGVPKPVLRELAKDLGKDHDLAQELWRSGVHEAMALASMIDDPAKVTEAQMETWTNDFDNWDICDQCCLNLFWKTAFAYEKAEEWSANGEEFVKRAGFVLMASLAIHDKKASDSKFKRFLSSIERGAADDRNFARKAVNWALRQIGKRNARLRQKAIETALELQQAESKSARWIGSDALRELTSDAVRDRVKSK
jgi:3-methyladenine DNA glycosylase AlkD